MLFELVYEFVL